MHLEVIGEERQPESSLVLGPHFTARVEVLLSRTLSYRCAPGCALIQLCIFLLQKQWDSKCIAQERESCSLFSGCGPELSGLHNGLPDSNRLLKTYCLFEFCCVSFFLPHEKKGGHSFQNTGHFFFYP